ncbi:MAG TPA: hypothetical protein VNT58_04940, partial [Gaiellaceae bacterium]|nr:hypothetical protein [Gaiellaceae bacterium]
MDGDAVAALEFDAILARVSAATATPRGQALARALTPSPAAEEVSRRQELTAEAVALLDEAAEPPLDGIHDIREAVAYAERGGALAPDALARIASTIAGGLRARAALDRVAAPRLAAIAADVDPALAAVAETIGRAVEEDGSDLRDTASPLLRRLRHETREGRQRVADALRRLARSPALAPHLQEDFVTERGGRPVLAVKASSR